MVAMKDKRNEKEGILIKNSAPRNLP